MAYNGGGASQKQSCHPTVFLLDIVLEVCIVGNTLRQSKDDVIPRTTTNVTSNSRSGSGRLTAHGESLARSMLQQICNQGLVEGDRFFTVREAARKYGVSTITAHRSMKQLAGRGILEMRPGSGSFVGSEANKKNNRVRIIHVVSGSRADCDMAFEGGLFSGLMKTMTDCSLQLNIEPRENITEYLQELWFGDGDKSTANLGGILFAASHETCMFFSQHGIPAVACGHVEEDVDLPYVDYDQHDLGYQIGDLLLDRGHQDVRVLMMDKWYPGDSLFLRGLQRSLARRALPADRLHVYPVMVDGSVYPRRIKRILRGRNSPKAVICRREHVALACLELALEMGLSIPEDLDLVSASPFNLLVPEAFPSVTWVKYDSENVAKTTGELLLKLIKGQNNGNCKVDLPVTLHVGQVSGKKKKVPPKQLSEV